MDDLNRGHLVLDNAGRDLVSLPSWAWDRRWMWAEPDGTLVEQAGRLAGLGSGRYEFTGTSPETEAHSGREGTEADLLAQIGTACGWHLPVLPVVMPYGVGLTV